MQFNLKRNFNNFHVGFFIITFDLFHLMVASYSSSIDQICFVEYFQRLFECWKDVKLSQRSTSRTCTFKKTLKTVPMIKIRCFFQTSLILFYFSETPKISAYVHTYRHVIKIADNFLLFSPIVFIVIVIIHCDHKNNKISRTLVIFC